jgi:FkbM family methyltransferase
MHFKMVSYADNFEDVLLRRAFPDLVDGFYIDVGAYDPVDHSVTQHFYEGGWRGINIEPNPVPFAKIQAVRQRDINLNIGLSNREGHLTLFEAPDACWSVDRNLLTGYFGARADQIVERHIPVLTLAQICEQHVPAGRSIEFLKIDVEGHELEVIRGNDWSRWRPRVILCESNGSEAWEPILLAADYHFAIYEGVNKFYVRGEDKHLLARLNAPANPSDRFLIYGYLRRINDLERQLGHYKEVEQSVLSNCKELEQSLSQTERSLSQTERSLSQYDDLSPMALSLARRLVKTARRHPRAASIAKKIVRRLGA